MALQKTWNVPDNQKYGFNGIFQSLYQDQFTPETMYNPYYRAHRISDIIGINDFGDRSSGISGNGVSGGIWCINYNQRYA